MGALFRSATRFALVVFVAVLSIALLFVVFSNSHQPDLVTGILGLFSNVMVAVISFYFGQKGLPTGATMDTHAEIIEKTTSTSTDTASPPFFTE